jgi:hypothetical protein
VTINTPITMTVTIANRSDTELINLTFKNKLEAGIEYLNKTSFPVRYISSTREISYTIKRVPAGETVKFDYTRKVTALNSSNHLTETISVGSTTEVVVGRASTFTRTSNQSLTHNDNTDFSTGDDPFSIALWAKVGNKTYHNTLIY